MRFCSENAKDIDKYFRHSYMKFVGMQATLADGSPVPFSAEAVHFVEHVSAVEIKGKTLREGEKVPFVFHLDKNNSTAPEIEFILPKKSYFNTPQGACLLYRIPARQYRKGVCPDNTAISCLVNVGSFVNQDITFELLNLYVGKQSFDKFAEQNKSYAVSRRMAVSLSGNLFLDKTRIGSINYVDKTIHVNQLMFVPEVESVVRANKQMFTVLVKGESTKKVKKVTDKYGIDDNGEVVMFEELA